MAQLIINCFYYVSYINVKSMHLIHVTGKFIHLYVYLIMGSRKQLSFLYSYFAHSWINSYRFFLSVSCWYFWQFLELWMEPAVDHISFWGITYVGSVVTVQCQKTTNNPWNFWFRLWSRARQILKCKVSEIYQIRKRASIFVLWSTISHASVQWSKYSGLKFLNLPYPIQPQ